MVTDNTIDSITTPLVFSPGSSWEYSSGIDWAGQVVEKLTGKSLGTYMAENIFTPLGMENTVFRPDCIVERKEIECSFRTPDGSLLPTPAPVPREPEIESGGAGLWSTADDCTKFLRALLASQNGSTKEEQKILKKETIQEMFRPQLDAKKRETMKIQYGSKVPFPAETVLDHGIGGAITPEGIPGMRSKGSLTWGAMTNCYWVSEKSVDDKHFSRTNGDTCLTYANEVI